MNDPGHRIPDSIDDALRADHERLDALLRELLAAMSARSPMAASEVNRFGKSLAHHMAWEDDHLFPAVKGVAGAKERRSIESLEIDHERLRDTLRSLELTIASGDYVTAGTLVQWLETLLKGHNYDEEHGVYVEADRLIGVAERRRLIDRFRVGEPP